MCPQSGDAAAGLSALVYGVPAPWQVTVLPSPGCQVTETGVAVAVTLSPSTVAVFDSGTHSAELIHSQVGKFVSCRAFWAGLERITRLGSPRVWRASAARGRRRRPGPGGSARRGRANRAGQRLHRDLAAGRDAAECLVHRALAAARRSAPGGGPGRRLAARLGTGAGRGAGDGPDPAVTSHCGEYDWPHVTLPTRLPPPGPPPASAACCLAASIRTAASPAASTETRARVSTFPPPPRPGW